MPKQDSNGFDPVGPTSSPQEEKKQTSLVKDTKDMRVFTSPEPDFDLKTVEDYIKRLDKLTVEEREKELSRIVSPQKKSILYDGATFLLSQPVQRSKEEKMSLTEIKKRFRPTFAINQPVSKSKFRKN